MSCGFAMLPLAVIRLKWLHQKRGKGMRKGYDGLDRIVLVVDRWGRTCKMVDLIHLQKQRFHHVVTDELKTMIPKMVHHILFPTCEEVVNHDHMISPRHQLVHKMASYESRPSCDHHSQHLPLQPQWHFCCEGGMLRNHCGRSSSLLNAVVPPNTGFSRYYESSTYNNAWRVLLRDHLIG